jgi:hypothetical protein
MLRIPKVGEHLCLLIPAVAHDPDDVEIKTPVGTKFRVESRRVLANEQGFQFELSSDEYRIIIFIDETDLIDHCYPFEPVPSP